jgi:capsular exopolysaccharide synthesis family protein
MQAYRYLMPLRKWWWLLVGAGVLAGITSILALHSIPPTYQATSTLIVGQALDNPNPNSGEFYLSQQLASIYASLATKEPIREAVKSALKLTELPSYAVRALPDNQLIEISVTDTSPTRARDVANEIAHQLILQSPSSSDKAQQERANFITSQLDFLQKQIGQTLADIADLQSQMAEMVSASDLERAQETLDTLQQRLLTFQTNYASILSSSGSGVANILRVFDSAQLPESTSGPSRVIIIALAIVLGIGMAAGGAYLVEFLDIRLKTPEEISAALELPILGYIPRTRRLKNLTLKDFTDGPLLSVTQEFVSFDLLATNLSFRFGDTPPESLLVTSLKSGAGKSTVASLLATQLALRGLQITLVDADLRGPDIQDIFGLDMHPGMVDALRDSISFKNVLQSTGYPRLRVITSGAMENENPQLIKPAEAIRLLDQLKSKMNLVIIDSPPVVSSETLLLASKVDAVLLIVCPGEIEPRTARVLLDQLQQGQGNILGIVVNQMPAYMVGSYGITPYLGHLHQGKVTKPAEAPPLTKLGIADGEASESTLALDPGENS